MEHRLPERMLGAGRKAGRFTDEELEVYGAAFRRPEYARASVQALT